MLNSLMLAHWVDFENLYITFVRIDCPSKGLLHLCTAYNSGVFIIVMLV